MLQKYTSDWTIVQMCYDIAASSWHIRAIRKPLHSSTATNNTIYTGSSMTCLVFLKPFFFFCFHCPSWILNTTFYQAVLFSPPPKHISSTFRLKWYVEMVFCQVLYILTLQRDRMNWVVSAMVLNCFASTAIQSNAAYLHMCIPELHTDSIFVNQGQGWVGSLAMIMYETTPPSVFSSTVF